MSTGMECPKCAGEKTEVKDSRPGALGIRRRRRCAFCGHRFTTYETTVDLAAVERMGRQVRAVSQAIEVLGETAEGLVNTSSNRIAKKAEIEFEVADSLPSAERKEALASLRNATELLTMLHEEQAGSKC